MSYNVQIHIENRDITTYHNDCFSIIPRRGDYIQLTRLETDNSDAELFNEFSEYLVRRVDLQSSRNPDTFDALLTVIKIER